ncbi:DUF5330 domain-containing protein [Rhizobiaceae bacterium n13]|uniref:DUF5330 domain-containing protein n=1 Tax=Ferirhizobium litorale TaxID=2927786 RepID=A0AAE3U2J2_9HYPH|nr:DUF5330 domain-containing protein [Fererhizobium litorale]MDI7861286.1 DUF5330 domain-containing protein [Fererhizobium litorale]MDI7921433.1 DUF5330 domain-containing protein [Fererhizobium litorale]
MWFLIKGSFWFALVLVALSFFGPPPSEEADGPRLELTDAFGAATQAYQYVTAICLEKPDVCEKGAEAFTALGHRAREGARVAYELLGTQFGDDTAEDLTPPAELATSTKAGENEPVAEKTASDAVVTGTVVPQPYRKPAL